MSGKLNKLCELTLAGVQHHDYKDGLSSIGSDGLDLVAEPNNPHDKYAVKVMHRGKLVGYVARGGLQQVLSMFLKAGYKAIASLKSPDLTHPVLAIWIPESEL